MRPEAPAFRHATSILGPPSKWLRAPNPACFAPPRRPVSGKVRDARVTSRLPLGWSVVMRIFYGGRNFLAGQDAVSLLLEYSAALARSGGADVVQLRTVDPDGTVEEVSF